MRIHYVTNKHTFVEKWAFIREGRLKREAIHSILLHKTSSSDSRHMTLKRCSLDVVTTSKIIINNVVLCPPRDVGRMYARCCLCLFTSEFKRAQQCNKTLNGFLQCYAFSGPPFTHITQI